MTSQTIDEDAAWAAVTARSREADGRFVTGVLTTGIYCRPSCAARHPRRENVRFFADGGAAREAGLRPCLRCRPDDVSRDEAAVAAVLAAIGEAEEMLSLTAVSAIAGYSPHHFQRVFKRTTGVSPAEYQRARRAEALESELSEASSITEAVYAAGYSGPGRFYADAKGGLGMPPPSWRDGGRGETIRYASAETMLGTMLLAATERGICRLSFDEDAAELARRFPNAEIVEGGDGMSDLLARTIAAVNEPERPHSLPLDVRGTAFQQAVWRELSRIPPGETLSYAALAAKAGKPGAVRAAGTACGANHIAVLIPCHRAKRTDGSLGGYAYGLDRKARLLEKEGGSLV